MPKGGVKKLMTRGVPKGLASNVSIIPRKK